MKHNLCVLKSKKVLSFFAELLPKLSKQNQNKLLIQGEMCVSNKKSNKLTLSETKPIVSNYQKNIRSSDIIAKNQIIW